MAQSEHVEQWLLLWEDVMIIMIYYIYTYIWYKQKYLKYITCMCVYLCTLNTSTQYIDIYYVNKNLTKTFILDVINCDLTTHFTL